MSRFDRDERKLAATEATLQTVIADRDMWRSDALEDSRQVGKLKRSLREHHEALSKIADGQYPMDRGDAQTSLSVTRDYARAALARVDAEQEAKP